MTQVFHRQLTNPLHRAVKGSGVYLFDDTGKRYLDASGGAAVSCLGHGDPDVVLAIKAQLDSLAFAHTGFFTSEPAEALADFLGAAAPGDIAMVYFVSGGSEAVEASLKMARQYHLERGDKERTHFIARRQSYHGNTIGALSVGGNIWRREPFKEMLIEATHIAPCYAYRDCLKYESEKEYGERVASELETEILRIGPERIAAFIAETVGGATAGVIPPVQGYFARIREICDQYGVLLILDEVMCGMGRTGTLFAHEQDGIVPDIVCVAKGLGGGYQPIGAVLTTERVYRVFQEGTGLFQHGHTYMGHSTACAAALAVQKKIRSKNLLSQVCKRGEDLSQRLHQRFAQHTYIGDIRGRGLFQAIELVKDRTTKEPFDPALRMHARIKALAMENGLICYPSGGTVDGVSGDHVLLAPPFIVELDHLDELVEKLGFAIDGAFMQAGVV